MRAGRLNCEPRTTAKARLHTLTLMLVIAVAASFAAACTAGAAAPEIGRCVKVSGGAYEDRGCTTGSASHTGGYEWEPGLVNSGFTFASKVNSSGVESAANFTSSGYTISVDCSGLHGTGTVAGPEAISGLVLRTSRCREEVTGEPPCTTPGLAGGEMETSTLSGQLGYLARSPLTVGLAFSAASGEPFSDLGCLSMVSLWGGVITKEPKVNVMVPSITLTYKDGKPEGLQQYSQFEGEPADVLRFNGTAGREVAMRVTAVITFKERAEIRALP
jgi:hypothetical protein